MTAQANMRTIFPGLLARAVALGMLLVAGCVSPYVFTEKIPPRYQLTPAEATRLAGQAMQAVGYFATSQDERQGHIVGERQGRATLDVDMFAVYLDVRFTPAAPGELEMSATCTVSKNIAYTDELDDECEKFRAAFRRALDARAQARPPAAVPAPATPVPRSRPAQPARKEYDL
jgi:hypothetical protein